MNPPLVDGDSALVLVQDIAFMVPQRILQVDAGGGLIGEYHAPGSTNDVPTELSLWPHADGSHSLLMFSRNEDRVSSTLSIYSVP